MNNKRKKSFTLIELLVVIVIIGILAGVIMISTSSSIDKANITKTKVFSESIRNNMLLNLKMEFSLDSIHGSVAPYSTNDYWEEKSMNLYYYSSTVSPYQIANDCSFSGTFNCPQLLDKKECIKGKCFNFNFTNHPFIELSVEDATQFNNGDSWTISSWIKLFTSSTVQYIGTRGTGNYLGIEDNNKFSFRNSFGTIYTSSNSSPKVRDQNWHLITWVANRNGSIFIYIDSQLEATILTDNNAFLFRNIGQAYTSSTSISRHFRGHMDELQIYNVALTQSEIKEVYSAGLKSMLAQQTK